MTRIFAARAKALEVTNTLSGAWQSGAHWYSDQSGAQGQWDSTKYDILGGMFYHEGQAILSGQLQVQQAVASGQWDLTTSFTPKLSTAYEFEVPLRGSFVRVHLRHAAATSNQNVSGPSVLRLGTWGKVADNVAKAQQYGYHPQSGDWQPMAVNAGGQLQLDVDHADTFLTATVLQPSDGSGGTVLISAQVQQVLLKALAANSGPIMIGGTGSYRAYSNFGYALDAGNEKSFHIDNLNKLTAFAVQSGDRLSYGAVNNA